MELRSPEEIATAHNRLVAIRLGLIPNPFRELSDAEIRFALDVLCWVLRHNEKPQFSETFRTTSQILKFVPEESHLLPRR